MRPVFGLLTPLEGAVYWGEGGFPTEFMLPPDPRWFVRVRTRHGEILLRTMDLFEYEVIVTEKPPGRKTGQTRFASTMPEEAAAAFTRALARHKV